MKMKVIFRVSKYENIDEKMSKQKRWVENGYKLKICDENTIK